MKGFVNYMFDHGKPTIDQADKVGQFGLIDQELHGYKFCIGMNWFNLCVIIPHFRQAQLSVYLYWLCWYSKGRGVREPLKTQMITFTCKIT